MTWSSRVGKTRARDRLLDLVARVRPWGGDEIVIDVGCGSGLLLIGAAKRLDGGTAIGFDVWRAKDLSANSADTARANAEAEGVAERVRIETGDARSLPLGDAGVDVVLSHWVLHNLDPSGDRVKALDEMWRVLRPGGVLLVADIAFVADYVAYLRSLGAVCCEFLDGGREARIMGLLSGGTYRPQALICRKPSGETATGSVEAACASR